MLKESTTFSTIRTRWSYPASQKHYHSGARADDGACPASPKNMILGIETYKN